jgi:glycosyltransferase involved in cell wall biosynthesis
MIAALRRLGCEVVVVEPSTTANTEFGGSAGATTVLRALLPRFLSDLLELAYSLVAYWRMRRAVLLHRPDVLYERHNLFLMAGVWLKRHYGLPYMLEVNSPLCAERERNGELNLIRLARRLEVSVWKSADIVLPVTRVLGDILVDQGVDRSRIEVIPNGINLHEFDISVDAAGVRRSLDLSGRFVLGFTGFVRPWHGLDQVIDFIADANRPDLFLLVVGDGPARDALTEHARKRGVQDQVHFTGIVDRSEVPSYLAAFDVALQPAATPYASPLKLFEYLAMARPIVAPNQPNLAEVLVDGQNALLFEPGDRASLFAALERIVSDAELRTRLSAAARQTIFERGLTWTRNAERVIAEAQRLIAAKHAGVGRIAGDIR